MAVGRRRKGNATAKLADDELARLARHSVRAPTEPRFARLVRASDRTPVARGSNPDVARPMLPPEPPPNRLWPILAALALIAIAAFIVLLAAPWA